MRALYRVAIVLVLCTPLPARADEPTIDPEMLDEGEIIVVVGSGGREGRTIVDSPVAIDVIDSKRIANESGQIDLNRILHLATPSFNANRQSGADGADHIEPATLRGLGPDQTLVLINGKRRHQSSLINLFGTRGRGNTGTDLNTIPLAAVERIEVLRDGASALYGSDAIAGVINLVLKENVGTLDTWVNASANLATPPKGYDVGATEKVDGQELHVSGNYGVGLGDGFVNATVDYSNKSGTQRPADPEKFSVYRRRFGDAAVERVSTMLNAEYPLGPVTLFGFADYTFRDTDAFAWTREPDSERNVPEIYPDGFDPRITSIVQDVAGTAGARFDVARWNVEVSNTYGLNDFDYEIKNTLNASLLTESPTRFDAGGHRFSQNVSNLTVGRTFGESAPRLAMSMGSELRVDRFQIFAGEEGSYRNYGIVEREVDGVTMLVDELGRPGGSQGFPGYRPENEVNEIRTNAAGFVSGALDVTRDLLVDVAARYEHYSDFGGTINARIATRLELVDLLRINFMHHLALRASASTGFRAPSLAQIHYNSVFTDFEGGIPKDKIIAKNSGDIARAVGIPALNEEKSRNLSAGISAQVKDFRLTVDGYYVDIRDRIVLSGAFDDTDAEIGADLMAMGVTAAQFFTNALDTRTLGVDAVLDGSVSLGRHRFRPQLSGNWNRMKLGAVKLPDRLAGKEDAFFGEREKHFLLASAPKTKIGVGLGYEYRSFFANARAVRWGGVTLIDYTDMQDIYKPKITTDVSLGWHIGDRLTLILGGTNIFNVYPTQQDTETESGGLWDAVQMGYNGAQYFAKVNAKI